MILHRAGELCSNCQPQSAVNHESPREPQVQERAQLGGAVEQHSTSLAPFRGFDVR